MDIVTVKFVLDWLERMIQEWGVRKVVTLSGGKEVTEWSAGRRVEGK